MLELPVRNSHFAYDPPSRTAIAAGSDSSGKMRTLWHSASISGVALLADGRFVTRGANGLLKCRDVCAAPHSLATNIDASPDSASANGTLAFVGEKLMFQNFVRRNHILFEFNPPSMRWFVRPEGGDYEPRFPVIRSHTNELVVDSPAGLSFYPIGREGLNAPKNKSADIAEPRSAAFDASGRLMVVSKDDWVVGVYDLHSHQWLPTPEARGRGIVAINPWGHGPHFVPTSTCGPGKSPPAACSTASPTSRLSQRIQIRMTER